jgi:hypothetical protein
MAAKVDKLITQMDIKIAWPDLAHVDEEYVVKLLLAQQAKENVRQRATSVFCESNRLKQAVEGKNPRLGMSARGHIFGSQLVVGTKLHQRTLNVMKNREPAHKKAITHYNKLCAELKELHKDEYNVPPPLPLQSSIEVLKEDPDLMQDVWIGKPSEPIPRWVTDEKVRNGIRGILLLDRCKEERARVTLESRNLLNWYEKSVAALEVARRLSDGMFVQLSSTVTKAKHI